MKRAVLVVLALAACDDPPAPRERVVSAILSLRYGMRPGLSPHERPSTEAALQSALATAGTRLECGGEWSNELGVILRGCSGTVRIAGCATPISARLERYVFEDNVPGLDEVRLDEPDLADCGPRLDPPRTPWTTALETRLEGHLGSAAIDGVDRSWHTGAIDVLFHDAHREPCRWLTLTPCRSYVEFAAPTAVGPRARAANP